MPLINEETTQEAASLVTKEAVLVSDDTNDSVTKKSPNEYWPKEVEDAIETYLYIDEEFLTQRYNELIERNDIENANLVLKRLNYAQEPHVKFEKERLFNKSIIKPLNKLIENIVFNFGLIRHDTDIKTLHYDCLTFVYTKFSNYIPGCDTKAFSYYGTTAKHYLLNEKKELYINVKANLDFDSNSEEVDSKLKYEIDDVLDIDKSLKFFHFICENLDNIVNGEEAKNKKKRLTENEKKVGYAIIEMFNNYEEFGGYKKVEINHIIKEMTYLDSKEVSYAIQRLKQHYKEFKKIYNKNTSKMI